MGFPFFIFIVTAVPKQEILMSMNGVDIRSRKYDTIMSGKNCS